MPTKQRPNPICLHASYPLWLVVSASCNLVDSSRKLPPKLEYPRNVQPPQKFLDPRSLPHMQLNRKGSLAPVFGQWEKNTVVKHLQPKTLKDSNFYYNHELMDQRFQYSIFLINFYEKTDDHYLLCQRPGCLRGIRTHFEFHLPKQITQRQTASHPSRLNS